MARPAGDPTERFFAELAERPQDGIGVDAEDGGEILGGRESFARFRFAVGDGPADLAGYLLVELEGFRLADDATVLVIRQLGSDASHVERAMEIASNAAP